MKHLKTFGVGLGVTAILALLIWGVIIKPQIFFLIAAMTICYVIGMATEAWYKVFMQARQERIEEAARKARNAILASIDP